MEWHSLCTSSTLPLYPEKETADEHLRWAEKTKYLISPNGVQASDHWSTQEVRCQKNFGKRDVRFDMQALSS
jgi:hypothetical protein